MSLVATNTILSLASNTSSMHANQLVGRSSSLSLASASSSSSAAAVTSVSSASAKQLVELAAEQKNVNYYLCLFHYQLIRILYLISKYSMKSVRPYSFFDTKVHNSYS